MGIENREIEPIQQTKPTELDLFNYPADSLAQSRQLFDDLSNLHRMNDLNKKKWEEQNQKLKETFDKLSTVRADTDEQLGSIISSKTVSKAYLFFFDEFSPQGLSEDDIFTFYKSCLAINTRIYSTVLPEIGDRVVENISQLILTKGFINRVAREIIKSANLKPPEWFSGSKEKYIQLVCEYSMFGTLLSGNQTQDEAIREIKKADVLYKTQGIVKTEYSAAMPDATPDWLLNNEESPPARDDVEAELASDKKEEELLRIQLMNVFKQKNFLVASQKEKAKKSEEWFRTTLRQATDRVNKYDLSTNLIFNSTFPQASSNSGILLDYIEEKPDAELYSLWVENLFKEAGIIAGKSLTDDGLHNLIIGIAAQKGENPEMKSEFESTRYTNKACYNILRHDLGRIVRVFPEDRTNFLKEYIDECGLSDSNRIITCMADLFVETITSLRRTQPVSEDIKKSLDSCKKFVRKFVDNNNAWLFNELKRKLYPSDKESEVEVESITLNQIDIKESFSEPETISEPQLLIQEFEQELAAVDRSKLADWQVICALDTSMNEHSFLAVPGITTDEKTVFLQHQFASKGMSCSVKFTSVINALEWKIESPQSVENLVPTELINGIPWKKMKRQAVRIYYQMSPEEKKIVFYILQRKNWPPN